MPGRSWRCWSKGSARRGPGVRIVLRGDSGFCRHKMLSWCERQGVGYIVGLAKNARLNDLAAPWMETAAQGFAGTGFKQRLFGEFAYAAGTWNAERRVIARIEHGPKGANPRYIVTNLEGDAQDLYEKLYCARGDMENRIKEQQLDLFADRTACHKWWPNQFRLLLSSLAYALVETIRRLGLAGTEMARAQAGTIRLQALEDRRRHRAQHAARALPTLQRLPGQGPVHAGCRTARPRIAVKKRVQSRPESRRPRLPTPALARKPAVPTQTPEATRRSAPSPSYTTNSSPAAPVHTQPQPQIRQPSPS